MDTLDGKDAHGIITALPQCLDCAHWHTDTATCKAFPEEIPDEIFLGRMKHDKPYPGDHGIRFERRM